MSVRTKRNGGQLNQLNVGVLNLGHFERFPLKSTAANQLALSAHEDETWTPWPQYSLRNGMPLIDQRKLGTDCSSTTVLCSIPPALQTCRPAGLCSWQCHGFPPSPRPVLCSPAKAKRSQSHLPTPQTSFPPLPWCSAPSLKSHEYSPRSRTGGTWHQRVICGAPWGGSVDVSKRDGGGAFVWGRAWGGGEYKLV